MSDLRNKIIKLAYEKPELREDLLPLIKKSRSEEISVIIDNFSGAVKKELQDDYPSSKDLELAFFEEFSPQELIDQRTDYGGIHFILEGDSRNIKKRARSVLENFKRTYPKLTWELK